MSLRQEPVVEFTERPEPGPVRGMMDTLQSVLGKLVSFADVLFLADTAGHGLTPAASPGTSLGFTSLWLDTEDAGADQARIIVRGNVGGAGESVTVTVHDTTNNVELAQVQMTNPSAQTLKGEWTNIDAKGDDRQVEVRAIGDGVDTATLFRVSLQLRTTQRRA